MILNVKNHESATENTQSTENPIMCSKYSKFSQCSKCSKSSQSSYVFSVADARDAATRWIPDDIKGVNRALFQFAREMRSLLPDAVAEEMEPYLAIWYRVASDYLKELDWGEVLCDFEFKLEEIKYPVGQDPLSMAIQEANEHEPPECSTRYGGNMGRLVHILQRLQMKNRNKSFYLSVRVAGRILGTTKDSAARMLRYLVLKGVLEIDHSIEYDEFHARRYYYRGEF
jgi:hypothetical protein